MFMAFDQSAPDTISWFLSESAEVTSEMTYFDLLAPNEPHKMVEIQLPTHCLVAQQLLTA